MATDVQTFTLDQEEVEVNLKSKGELRECILREMDGFERDKYLNSQRTKLERESQTVKDFTDVQTSLIAKCLFEKSTNELVPLEEIRKFPSKLQTQLYMICMRINGLDQNSMAAAKNS